MRGPVIDTSTLKLREIFQLQLSVLRARSNHHRARRNLLSIPDQHCVRAAIASQAFRVFRNQYLRAELLRLRVGAAGKLVSRYAGREAKIVFDFRAGSRLAAGPT